MGTLLFSEEQRTAHIPLWKDALVSESQSEINWADTKVYVAGHRGLVGSALVRSLEAKGAGEIVGWTSGELDLR